MEERTRFTVFKLWVESKDLGDGWFVFRRYTDFLRLNRKLKSRFPGLRLVLPPKKWFGDNFDPSFLEDRLLGLQAYVTSITNHPEISQQICVREFFCLDAKPDPHDSIEESRAMCQSLEQKIRILKRKLKEKDSEINQLHAEVAMMRAQQDTLVKGLKLECSVTALTQSRSTPVDSPRTTPSSHCDSPNVNKILGIHNVNVTLLHMMEHSTGQQGKPDDIHLYNNKDSTEITEVNSSEPFLLNGLDQLKLHSESQTAVDVPKEKNNNMNNIGQQSKMFLQSRTKELDSPTSSDSGYREELLATAIAENRMQKPEYLPVGAGT